MVSCQSFTGKSWFYKKGSTMLLLAAESDVIIAIVVIFGVIVFSLIIFEIFAL